MSSLFHPIAVTAVLIVADVAVYLRLRKRKYDKQAFRKDIMLTMAGAGLLLLCFICYVGFDAYKTDFICSKDTMTCLHREATLFNPDLHDVKTYDVADVSSVIVKIDKGRSTRYNILLQKQDGHTVRFPVSFYSWETEELEREANRIKAFFKSGVEQYVFHSARAKPDVADICSFFFPFFLIGIAGILLRRLLENLKRSSPNEDSVIIRNGGDR